MVVMNNKLTIKRIAELSGVSKATVSRVLNGYPHISRELREKVQKVIDDTGYQPNNVARLLASDRSNIIGLVIPSGPQMVFNDPYFPALTEGIAQSTNRYNLILALFVFQSEQEGRDTIQGILTSGLLDGLIITADKKGDLFIPQLIANEMPFVYIGRPDNTIGISYVDADNLSGGYIATKHLIDLGYQRIATIASNKNSAGDDRLKGYRQALEMNEINVDDALVEIGDYTLDSGYTAMKRLLDKKPDAVFVASDTMTLGAIRAINESDLKIPDDIAVIGHDDLPPAMQADPELTTIRQPIAGLGSIAVETLAKVINSDDNSGHKIILPTKLIIRDSCGAV
jgi:LacI family transcriptional regulator